MRGIVKISCILVGVIFLMSFTGEAEDKVTIRISSGSLGGSWYPFGAAVGENILKPAGFEYTNEPGGGTSNVVAVSTAKTDIGLTMTTSIAMAATGDGPYKGKEYTNLVALASLFNDPLHIMVPENSGITTVADLKGKKIASAAPGQLAETVMLDVFSIYGIAPDDVTLQKGSPNDHVPLYKDGHVDAWIYIMPPPSSQATDMAISRDSRLISLTEEDLQKLSEKRNGYSLLTIPGGTYPGIDQDAVCLNTKVVFIAREDMPDEVAYDLAKAFVDHIEVFGNSLAIMKGMTPADLANVPGGIQVHPGALKFYKEIGAVK